MRNTPCQGSAALTSKHMAAITKFIKLSYQNRDAHAGYELRLIFH
jgi:hypothetical protein